MLHINMNLLLYVHSCRWFWSSTNSETRTWAPKETCAGLCDIMDKYEYIKLVFHSHFEQFYSLSLSLFRVFYFPNLKHYTGNDCVSRVADPKQKGFRFNIIVSAHPSLDSRNAMKIHLNRQLNSFCESVRFVFQCNGFKQLIPRASVRILQQMSLHFGFDNKRALLSRSSNTADSKMIMHPRMVINAEWEKILIASDGSVAKIKSNFKYFYCNKCKLELFKLRIQRQRFCLYVRCHLPQHMWNERRAIAPPIFFLLFSFGFISVSKVCFTVEFTLRLVISVISVPSSLSSGISVCRPLFNAKCHIYESRIYNIYLQYTFLYMKQSCCVRLCVCAVCK